VCNECDEPLKPAGDVAQVHLDQAQLHADDYVDKNYELPKELFCKCEHGTPCFDTCFEFRKYVDERVREERQRVIGEVEVLLKNSICAKMRLFLRNLKEGLSLKMSLFCFYSTSLFFTFPTCRRWFLQVSYLEFYPRTVLQEAYPSMEIKEIDSGELTITSVVQFVAKLNQLKGTE